MPIRISSTSGGTMYGNPFVGEKLGPVAVVVDVSALTTDEVDEHGYLKAGVPLTINGALIGAANTAVVGIVPEAIKIADSNTDLASVTTDPFVTIYTIGAVNRDIIEDNLGRALTADEVAGLNGAPSRIVLTLT